jgi:hypothetical protein
MPLKLNGRASRFERPGCRFESCQGRHTPVSVMVAPRCYIPKVAVRVRPGVPLDLIAPSLLDSEIRADH